MLIKSIAQAIPEYAMMAFKIPKNICKGITDVFHNSGGVMTMTIRGFIGKPGGNYVNQSIREVWGSEICIASI